MVSSKPAPPAKIKNFVSAFPGEVIRLTLPDGGVAPVGIDPKPLPERFWRKALQSGCTEADGKPMTPAQLRAAAKAAPEADKSEDSTLIERLIEACKDILNGDPLDPQFNDAMTEQDIPRVDWLSKRVGANVTAEQRDEAWAKLQLELDGDEEDEEDEEDQE